LAAVVREALEQRRRIGLFSKVLEADDVLAELLVSPLHHSVVLDPRGGIPRALLMALGSFATYDELRRGSGLSEREVLQLLIEVARGRILAGAPDVH
jgi:hypothetical protein